VGVRPVDGSVPRIEKGSMMVSGRAANVYNVYTLTRIESIDVTYQVRARTLEEAVKMIQLVESESYTRVEDPESYFEADAPHYLGVDDVWHDLWDREQVAPKTRAS
jgi:hypothetical protein